MKCVTAKYGYKLVIAINFEGDIDDLFPPKCCDSKAADLKNKLKKIR